VNQSRDQYGKPEIQLQLTNTSGSPLTVTQADVTSPLFQGPIRWAPAGSSIELPPRQPKSLPAALPEPSCSGAAGSPSGETATATVLLAAGGESQASPVTIIAGDRFGVLQRNNSELCLTAAAAAVAGIVLDSHLEIAQDLRTAVVRLVVTPRPGTDGNDPGRAAASLTISSVDGTPLLAESPEDPWPRNITVRPGDGPAEWPLRIRAARCDPHAIAEDKVGTLVPLHVAVGHVEGRVTIPAGPVLRAQLYDFVTSACAAGQGAVSAEVTGVWARTIKTIA
jgi:hypothetical protein